MNQHNIPDYKKNEGIIMNNFQHIHVDDVPQEHKNDHPDYEFFRRNLRNTEDGDSMVAHYEIPPGKSAFPYHYHLKNEESYYILSGKGLLKTPEGEKEVCAGDFLFFPPDESGAHKLTNISKTENLVYLDFDTDHDLEVCIYPDTGKIAIWGKGINKLYKEEQNVGYYDGE